LIPQLTIEQKIESRLELRHELAMRLKIEIESTRGRVVGDPQAILDNVIQYALDQLQDDNIKVAITSLLEDNELRYAMLGRTYDLANPNEKKIEDLIISYLYDKHRGQFSFEPEDKKDENYTPDFLEVSKGYFSSAFTERKKQEEYGQDLKLSIKTLADQGKDTTGAQQDFRDVHNSLLVAAAMQETKSILEKGFTFAMFIRDSAKNPVLRNFMRELFLLEKFDMAVSERMEKRFATSFMGSRNRSKEAMKNAFINTIGEYVLISMGIVSPEVFTLQGFDQDRFEYESLKESLAESGLNLDQISAQYNLNKEGSVSWNRWKTIGMKPTIITDERVREFITKTVRADSEAIISGLDYDSLYGRAREISSCAKTKEEKEDANTELRELLVDTLSRESNVDLLIDLMKNHWYEKMDIFYSQQKANA